MDIKYVPKMRKVIPAADLEPGRLGRITENYWNAGDVVMMAYDNRYLVNLSSPFGDFWSTPEAVSFEVYPVKGTLTIQDID